MPFLLTLLTFYCIQLGLHLVIHFKVIIRDSPNMALGITTRFAQFWSLYLAANIYRCLFIASTFWNGRWNTASECLRVTLDISIITAMSICVNYIPSNHYRAEISRVDTSFLPLLTYLSDPSLWKLGSSLEMLVHYCNFVSPRVWRESEGKERDFVLKVVPYLMTLESFHQLSGLTDQDKALWLMFYKVNCRTK